MIKKKFLNIKRVNYYLAKKEKPLFYRVDSFKKSLFFKTTYSFFSVTDFKKIISFDLKQLFIKLELNIFDNLVVNFTSSKNTFCVNFSNNKPISIKYMLFLETILKLLSFTYQSSFKPTVKIVSDQIFYHSMVIWESKSDQKAFIELLIKKAKETTKTKCPFLITSSPIEIRRKIHKIISNFKDLKSRSFYEGKTKTIIVIFKGKQKVNEI